MTSNMKIKTDTQATMAIIANVCGLHKFNIATQTHDTDSPFFLRGIMPYNNQQGQNER